MQGGIYRTKAKGIKSPGGVSLVLGAGNQASVVAGDILFKLIHEDEVVVVKTNPVNEYVGKYLEYVSTAVIRLTSCPHMQSGPSHAVVVVQAEAYTALLLACPLYKSVHAVQDLVLFSGCVSHCK